MPEASKKSAELRIAKALKHPLRVEILSALDEGIASPVMLADKLDQPLGNVSYHVNELLKFDCLELVDTKQRRGAIEHFYKAVKRPYFHDRDWREIPLVARQHVSSAELQEITEDAADALEEGLFDARTDRHLSRTRLLLDEKGWGEMNAMLSDVQKRSLDLQAKAAKRLGEKNKGIPATLALLCFEAVPGPGADSKDA